LEKIIKDKYISFYWLVEIELFGRNDLDRKSKKNNSTLVTITGKKEEIMT
jgi:hypothetical protein